MTVPSIEADLRAEVQYLRGNLGAEQERHRETEARFAEYMRGANSHLRAQTAETRERARREAEAEVKELREWLMRDENVERIRRAALAPLASDRNETLREALAGVIDGA